MTKTLLLDCGSGGRASQRLINELFLEQFDNPFSGRWTTPPSWNFPVPSP